MSTKAGANRRPQHRLGVRDDDFRGPSPDPLPLPAAQLGHPALNRVLLDPLGPGGDRRFQRTLYDHTTDPLVTEAAANAVLIFDGVFLMRPELIDRWELRILVSTALDKTVERAVIRERHASSRSDVERRWRERYLPAQQLYFATARPAERADLIVHNDDPRYPRLEHRSR